MLEKADKQAPTDIFFIHVTTNISLDMNAIIADRKVMDVALKEYASARKALMYNFSFISTVLESITLFNPEWDKQINVSACLLAVEAYAMEMDESLPEILRKDKDIEAILNWTSLQYRRGAFRRNQKGYKWRVALMFLLLDEVSKQQQEKKNKVTK